LSLSPLLSCCELRVSSSYDFIIERVCVLGRFIARTLSTRASGLVFMFCAPVIVFGGTGGVTSRILVLRSRTRFWRCRVRRVPFSCFLLPDSFSAVPRAHGPFFMFCAAGLVFSVTMGVRSRFHVLRARIRFRRYRGRRVSFSCSALPDSFSTVPRASGPVFLFYASELVFGGFEGVGSLFPVLHPHTCFRRYRGRQVPFSCFARPDSFSTVPRASCPVFMFCAPGLVFGSTEGVGSLFHVLRSRTRFQRYGGRQVLFLCFACPETFSAYRGHRVPFSCFACPDSFSAIPRASGLVFMFCAPGTFFGGTGGVGSRVLVLRSRSHFRRFRGRQVPFSSFAPPYFFSTVLRASGPVFMFCASGLVFGGTEGVVSCFHVFCSRTRFQRYRGRRVPF
jgi:hypothetical protein